MGTLFDSEITADNARVTSATLTTLTCHFTHSRPWVRLPSMWSVRDEPQNAVPRGPALKLLRVPSGDTCSNGRGCLELVKTT